MTAAVQYAIDEAIRQMGMPLQRNCFEAAVHVATACSTISLEAVVCHGIPTGQGGRPKGKRYWHGWVEVLGTGVPGALVVDYSHGLHTAMPRREFYRLGRIDHDEVWRYTLDEARTFIDTVQHWGPWPDGWRTMTDEPPDTYRVDEEAPA
jgi:hypothetical protein